MPKFIFRSRYCRNTFAGADTAEILTAGQCDLHQADAARKVLLHDEKGRICRHLLRRDHADIDGNPEWHQIMLTLDGSDGDIAWVSQL